MISCFLTPSTQLSQKGPVFQTLHLGGTPANQTNKRDVARGEEEDELNSKVGEMSRGGGEWWERAGQLRWQRCGSVFGALLMWWHDDDGVYDSPLVGNQKEERIIITQLNYTAISPWLLQPLQGSSWGWFGGPQSLRNSKPLCFVLTQVAGEDEAAAGWRGGAIAAKLMPPWRPHEQQAGRQAGRADGI